MPHIRPISSPNPLTHGQDFETLLRLSQEGVSIVSGRPSTLVPQQPPASAPTADVSLAKATSTTTALTSKRSHSDGKKSHPTKCLGCGATETPEWRRGPLGPRTLCNACVSLIFLSCRPSRLRHTRLRMRGDKTDFQGLVHMKLQRKKRKLEEKAAAAEAAKKI